MAHSRTGGAASREASSDIPEVEGYVGSLLDAVGDGAIEVPNDVMTFKEWIVWRSGDGKRYHKTKAMSSSESQLCRETMAAMHGPGWHDSFW